MEAEGQPTQSRMSAKEQTLMWQTNSYLQGKQLLRELVWQSSRLSLIPDFEELLILTQWNAISCPSSVALTMISL